MTDAIAWTTKKRIAHRVGDATWNRIYAALAPFVSGQTQEIALRKHLRMTDAVMTALRASEDGSQGT